MYADRVSSGSKRSVKDRLYGDDEDQDQDDYNVPIRRHNITTTTNNNKRQRQNDDKWKHDLYDDDEEPQISYKVPKAGSRDLRLKLQNKNLSQSHQSAKGSNARPPQDLREKLSGSMHVQPMPMNNDVPKSKEVLEVTKPARKSVPAQVPAPETKKPSNTASKKKSQQKAEPSVDSLLQSLGLEKYSITFQAEEIDMTALMHMNDEDLKALGSQEEDTSGLGFESLSFHVICSIAGLAGITKLDCDYRNAYLCTTIVDPFLNWERFSCYHNLLELFGLWNKSFPEGITSMKPLIRKSMFGSMIESFSHHSGLIFEDRKFHLFTPIVPYHEF
ncbi:hypothetical protein AQUCO_10800047v1 [Aquilegia coerulea]|uniref:SAM domain-containing protein n=1 Tax=Aquilegia coerulea TaxID=218851 RepID=A0A2G5C3E7_AQUCA|nr:hypothetical protein AQUCO_10800047v1 [Aquilegia coerulea]